MHTATEEKALLARPLGAQLQERSGTKYAAIACLIAHTVPVVFLMRWTQSSDAGHIPALSASVVGTTEIVKLITSFGLLSVEQGGVRPAVSEFLRMSTPGQMVVMSVPGILYTVQNILLFIALAHLTATVFSTAYQLKTLTTALMSVAILGRRVTGQQWLALVILSLGGVLVSPISDDPDVDPVGRMGRLWGFAAVLGACLTSSFAGVYTEMLLKRPDVSLWMLNVQLSLLGAPMAFLVACFSDAETVRRGGMFQGYDGSVWAVVAMNAVGGFTVAAVLRYADNIVKCFANAAALVFTLPISWAIGELDLAWHNFAGISLVVGATLLYGIELKSVY